MSYKPEWEFAQWKPASTGAAAFYTRPDGSWGKDNVIKIDLNPNLTHRLLWVYIYSAFLDNTAFGCVTLDLILSRNGETLLALPVNLYSNQGGGSPGPPLPLDRMSAAPTGGVVKDLSLIFAPVTPIASTTEASRNVPEPNSTLCQPMSADYSADKLVVNVKSIMNIYNALGAGGLVIGPNELAFRIAVQTYAW